MLSRRATLLVMVTSVLFVAAAAAPARLPRENLLVYRSQSGDVAAVKSKEEWGKRRAEVLAAFQSVVGKLPGEEKKCPLEMKVLEETDRGSYVLRLIEYSSEPGGRVPAYLAVPKSALAEGGKKAPAVLCLHPTDNTVGHGVVVGLGGKANRQYASELAERGYVTLAPNYPLLAKYQPDVRGLGWESGTLKAVWDNIRGLDHKRIKRVTEVLDVGQMVEVQCLEVDPGRKRISLSVKALKAKPEAPPKPQDEDLAPGKGEAYQRKTKGPLKGGIGGANSGGFFGNPKDYSR